MGRVTLGVPRWVLWNLAVWAIGCGRTTLSEADELANVGGRPASGAGASNSGAASSFAGGSSLGNGASGSGNFANGGSPNTATGETSASAGRLGEPLVDTSLCGNAVVRVPQLPDMPLFFSGTFDGEPVDAFDPTDATKPPTFTVFRFGADNLEAIDLPFALSDSYSGVVEVTSLSCTPAGNLNVRAGNAVDFFPLTNAQLSSVTHSRDGYLGLAQGTLVATWANADGEQHVLDAKFALRARLDDLQLLP